MRSGRLNGSGGDQNGIALYLRGLRSYRTRDCRVLRKRSRYAVAAADACRSNHNARRKAIYNNGTRRERAEGATRRSYGNATSRLEAQPNTSRIETRTHGRSEVEGDQPKRRDMSFCPTTGKPCVRRMENGSPPCMSGGPSLPSPLTLLLATSAVSWAVWPTVVATVMMRRPKIFNRRRILLAIEFRMATLMETRSVWGERDSDLKGTVDEWRHRAFFCNGLL